MTSILIIQAHPDGSMQHFCHALAAAYRQGAKRAGHEVETLDLGQIDIPLVRSKAQWENGASMPPFVREAQHLIEKSDHLVFIYPLWLGTMPAVLKAWLEQVLRPDFAFNIVPNGKGWNARLGGRSARIVITMGMPAAFYSLFYFAHSLRSFERNVLKFAGVKPVRHSLIGMVDRKDPSHRERWLKRMEKLGEAAR